MRKGTRVPEGLLISTPAIPASRLRPLKNTSAQAHPNPPAPWSCLTNSTYMHAFFLLKSGFSSILLVATSKNPYKTKYVFSVLTTTYFHIQQRRQVGTGGTGTFGDVENFFNIRTWTGLIRSRLHRKSWDFSLESLADPEPQLAASPGGSSSNHWYYSLPLPPHNSSSGSYVEKICCITK